MNTKKIKTLLIAFISILFFIPSVAMATSKADLVFVVDQSGSMYNEFNWISNSLLQIDSTIKSKGITANYGLAGFEYTTGSQSTRYGNGNAWADLPSNLEGIISEADWAANNLYGAIERGYHAVDWATDNFSWTGGDFAKVMVMITDEDADEGDTYAYKGLYGESALKKKMEDENILLNVITSSYLFSVWDDVAFTKGDYIGLFDLDSLKNDSANFTENFTNAKINEIMEHETAAAVPEPGTMFLFGLGLLFLGGLCRKKDFSKAVSV